MSQSNSREKAAPFVKKAAKRAMYKTKSRRLIVSALALGGFIPTKGSHLHRYLTHNFKRQLSIVYSLVAFANSRKTVASGIDFSDLRSATGTLGERAELEQRAFVRLRTLRDPL